MQNGNAACAACVFFLVLLLTPVSPQCRTANADECKKSKIIVPGCDLASRGIDITRLEHAAYDVFNLNEWQKSDGSCTLCENPLLKGKPLQILPLAITDWKANISCQEKVQHSIHQSVISVAKAMTELRVKNDWNKELGMEVKFSANIQWTFTGSISKLTNFIQVRNAWDKYIFFLHHVSCSYYKFRISKDKSVSEDLKDDLNFLPEKYEPRSKMEYQNVIQNYGTHFLTELDVGAQVRVLTALPVCKMVLDGYSISEISVCLGFRLGILIIFDEVTKSPDFKKCQKMMQNQTLQELLDDHKWDIEGGGTSANSDLSYRKNSIKWLKRVKSQPALLSYSLEPLHTLLDKGNPRREGLRQAVSEYVRESALWRNCTHSCPPGVHLSAWDSCSCECPNDNFTNSMCCSKQRGLTKLMVNIQRAQQLWGDYITRSDGYVNVFFKDKVMCTSTVWNSDNPEWNVIFDVGIIQATDDLILKIEVWDEDFGWDDDLLGTCILILEFGYSSNQICHLKHGFLQYKYHLACGPHLGGSSCLTYIPLLPKEKTLI